MSTHQQGTAHRTRQRFFRRSAVGLKGYLRWKAEFLRSNFKRDNPVVHGICLHEVDTEGDVPPDKNMGWQVGNYIHHMMLSYLSFKCDPQTSMNDHLRSLVSTSAAHNSNSRRSYVWDKISGRSSVLLDRFSPSILPRACLKTNLCKAA